MQTKNANESVSECSRAGLCITVNVLRMLSLGNTCKLFKRVQFFWLQIQPEISHSLGLQKYTMYVIRL